MCARACFKKRINNRISVFEYESSAKLRRCQPKVKMCLFYVLVVHITLTVLPYAVMYSITTILLALHPATKVLSEWMHIAEMWSEGEKLHHFSPMGSSLSTLSIFGCVLSSSSLTVEFKSCW